MCNKQQINESGFTLVEVLISLVIVAFVVGPISFSLLSAIKMRISAEAVNQVTKTTERLMEDIKVELTNQIYNKQEIEGKRKIAIDLSATQGYKQCLLPSSKVPNRSEVHELKDFFEFNKEMKEIATTSTINLQQTYDTTHYAYEVALWRVEDITFDGEKFLLTPSQMNTATKLYTDSNYKWSIAYDKIAYPLSFQITSEMLKLFKDADGKYIPGVTSSTIKILDTKMVRVKEDQTLEIPEAMEGKVKLESNSITTVDDNNSNNRGYTIKVSLNQAQDLSAYPLEKTRINIEVDIRELIGNIKNTKENQVSNTSQSSNTKTLKFINTTQYDLVIRVKDNVLLDAYTSDEINQIDQKYNIVAVDNQSGKSTIVKKADIEPYENYIIAIIVREKNPVLGKPGKIIKKMIDVYSYDITTAQRR